MGRAPHVHPSGLSPSEYEAYAGWISELELQLSKLGRGLRFGELLGFLRKRTPVEREPEIMSYFGSMSQQQSLGVGEFVAILRLLAHARTCLTLCRDHIFIQTVPLVLSNSLSPDSGNPFFRTHDLHTGLGGGNPVGNSVLQKAAAGKKRIPLPPATTSSQIAGSSCLGGDKNPFRQGSISHTQQSPSARFPPTPPDSNMTAKSPPLPPRPTIQPNEPPPKHLTQQGYQKIYEPSLTPTQAKNFQIPAIGPTSIDIISSSNVQVQHTGQSTSSSTHQRLGRQNTGNRRSLNLTDPTIRLLGSSHIGVDARPLRAAPSPARIVKHSSSSEEFTLNRRSSDSSMSSLSAVQIPRAHRTTIDLSVDTTISNDLKQLSPLPDEKGEEILSPVFTAASANGKTTEIEHSHAIIGGVKPPLPPPPRRRPEPLLVSKDPASGIQRLVFGAEPGAAHPSPFTATSINSSSHKQRTHSAPFMHIRGRSVSATAKGPFEFPSGAQRLVGQSRNDGGPRGQSSPNPPRPIDLFLTKGRDVSMEWLERARAGMMAANAPGVGSARSAEDRQSLIGSDGRERAKLGDAAKPAEDADASESDSELLQTKTVQERKRELERLQPGWARLD
ncbi:MAG: hypothetical protein CYPHOPRED_001086 [Cyphobasidiales sp. Tagirdzhanova-0007]|nr:MAG: hypothetical protein CYPHOPRED_001086 [Cyphobasidiales sp. Tagirdzhanova-0007]